jgi:hypothetical protein
MDVGTMTGGILCECGSPDRPHHPNHCQPGPKIISIEPANGIVGTCPTCCNHAPGDCPNLRVSKNYVAKLARDFGAEATARAERAETQLAELRKRSEVTRAWITETCIANRGRDGAVEEALQRLRRTAHEVFDGWGERFRGDAKLHFVLQMERPTEDA